MSVKKFKTEIEFIYKNSGKELNELTFRSLLHFAQAVFYFEREKT